MKNHSVISESEFLGFITAGATHELNNVLAIIQESTGLIEDIARLSDNMDPSRRGTLNRCLKSVKEQIQRGVDLLNRLNALAHCPDQETGMINLEKAVDDMIVLCRRFAYLKKLQILPLSAKTEINIVTRPLDLRLALYLATRICMEQLPADGKIRIGASKENASNSIRFLLGHIRIGSFEPPSDASQNWLSLHLVAERLKASISWSTSLPGLLMLLPDSIQSTD